MLAQRVPTCFEIESTNGQTIIHIVGHKIHLGEEHVRLIEENVSELIDDYGNPEVILDMSNVDCVASTALGYVVSIQQQLEEHGLALRLRGMSPYVRELLEFAHLQMFCMSE